MNRQVNNLIPHSSPIAGRIVWIWGLLLITLLGGCRPQQTDTVFHQFQPIDRKGWTSTDTLTFHLTARDSQARYKLYIEARHTLNYPYRNLPLAWQLSTDSADLGTDSLNITLADRSGKWLGSHGKTLPVLSTLAGSLQLCPTDTYRIRVWHLLPDHPLRGLSDIGIRLTQ